MTESGTFIFICPACGYKARLPQEISGSTIKCPGCQSPQQARAQVNTERKTASFIRVAATPVPFTLPKEQEQALGAPAEPTPATMPLPVQPAPVTASIPTPLPVTLATDRLTRKDAPPSAKPAATGTINFVCSACHARMRLPAHYSGKSILCPKCSSPQRVAQQPSEPLTSRVVGAPSTVRPAVQITPLPGQLAALPPAVPTQTTPLPVAVPAHPTPRPTAVFTAPVAAQAAAPIVPRVVTPLPAPVEAAPVAPPAAPVAPAAAPAAPPLESKPVSEFNPTIAEPQASAVTANAPTAEAAEPPVAPVAEAPAATPAPAPENDPDLGGTTGQFAKPHPSKGKNPTATFARKTARIEATEPPPPSAAVAAAAVKAVQGRSSSSMYATIGTLGVLLFAAALLAVYFALALNAAHDRLTIAERDAKSAAQREQQASSKAKELETRIEELEIRLRRTGDPKGEPKTETKSEPAGEPKVTVPDKPAGDPPAVPTGEAPKEAPHAAIPAPSAEPAPAPAAGDKPAGDKLTAADKPAATDKPAETPVAPTP